MEVVAKQLHALPSLRLNKEKQASCFKRMSSEKVLRPYFTISGWKADWTGIYHIFAEAHTCTYTQNYTCIQYICSYAVMPLWSVWADWFASFKRFIFQVSDCWQTNWGSSSWVLLFGQLLAIWERLQWNKRLQWNELRTWSCLHLINVSFVSLQDSL